MNDYTPLRPPCDWCQHYLPDNAVGGTGRCQKTDQRRLAMDAGCDQHVRTPGRLMEKLMRKVK